jgi:hypothetical protein
MAQDAAREFVRAWRPPVPGVSEVLHAHFTEHAYPAHTHDHWTLLLVDTGGVDYAVDGRPRMAEPAALTVLPPHVPHDGRAARTEGFDKRVLYVDDSWLDGSLAGAAVDAPMIRDTNLVAELGRLHGALARAGSSPPVSDARRCRRLRAPPASSGSCGSDWMRSTSHRRPSSRSRAA